MRANAASLPCTLAFLSFVPLGCGGGDGMGDTGGQASAGSTGGSGGGTTSSASTAMGGGSSTGSAGSTATGSGGAVSSGSGGNDGTSTGGGASGGGASGGGASGGGASGGGASGGGPSNPDADCAARSLFSYLNDISGENILSGQESLFSDSRQGPFPSRRDATIEGIVGDYPALYSSDFGDFAENNLDDRQRVVDNALAYAQEGSVIQLHYHLVQPDLPDGSGYEAMSAFSSGNPYAAENIDRMLSPGDPLEVEHRRRLDEVADYLEQLEAEGIAVLWRPFHEMNGDWFWWGQQARFKDLWVGMWTHFTETRQLDNLLWVFSVNYWGEGAADDPELYYPGDAYVDVLGVDVYTEYGHSYAQSNHDGLRALAPGKPIAITENGEMPNVPALRGTQPNWVYWSTWWGFETAESGNPDSLYQAVYGDPATLTQNEVTLPACP